MPVKTMTQAMLALIPSIITFVILIYFQTRGMEILILPFLVALICWFILVPLAANFIGFFVYDDHFTVGNKKYSYNDIAEMEVSGRHIKIYFRNEVAPIVFELLTNNDAYFVFRKYREYHK